MNASTYAASIFALLAGCTANVDPPDMSPDGGMSEDPAILQGSVIARAEQWVHAKLHYCQSPNHERDFDAACSATCERTDNAEWDPYRSDCSGLVSWAWGLDAPGRTTLGFAPFRTDITHVIDAIDLKEGDAINNSDHVMLFKAWTEKGHTATFLEEPGCSSETPYAHQVTVAVEIHGTQIFVPYNGMTFSAIRFHGITDKPPLTDESDRIGVSTWGPGRLDLFARDGAGHLEHRYLSSGTWHDWQGLGGELASAPSAVSWAEGRIDVFAKGRNDHLVHTWYDGQWHSFEDLGGDLSSAPVAISHDARSLDVFARNSKNELAHKYFRPGTGWSGWQDLGGDLASSPTAAVMPSGRIDVFARDSRDNLTRIHFADGAWSAWGALEGPISTGPTVASWAEGRLDVFAGGADGKLMHRYFEDDQWADWQELGGSLSSPPTAVTQGPHRLDVFARGGDDEAIHRDFDGGWGGWEFMREMPQ